MYLKYASLIFLIGLIMCEDHIPRVKEPGSEEIHQKILEESVKPLGEKVGQKKVEKPVLGESSNMPPILKESLPIEIENAKTVSSGGMAYIHNPSYITLTMLVLSRNVDCYYYKATSSFEVDFQVIKGGTYDIAVAIYDDKANRVSYQKPSNDGNLKVMVPPEMINKDYSICFDNHEASRATKKVFMMIDITNSNNINTPEYAQLNKLDLLHTTLSNIYTSLIQIEHLQEKQRSIEAIDRSIMERNFEYVTMWCFIQITVMIIVSAVQIILIRSLFDSKGGIGATIWKKLHDLTGGRF